MAAAAGNRLQHETSPYLLQHAHNPVDWYPWGEEALQKAQAEDKPILVSIGYSACHWCHVMEKECFEQEEVAQLMNAHFINIKVDREERPDVDQIYMEAVQTMGVQGGWPLNVFLTPDQKPFYGGTYFPKRNWMMLLQNVAQAFRQSRQQLEESAEQFALNLAFSDIQRYGITNESGVLSRQDLSQQLSQIYGKFSQQFDTVKGGMNRAPKFPMPTHWLFLLRYHALTQNQEALQQTTLTLDRMAFGGLYDQLGGGFARYSVDADWFAPHFEKMLYDNGQLLSLYAEAYALTKNPNYRQVLEETVAFLRREMTHPAGGFYSALDADSEGEEGKFYVWHQQELHALLGDKAALVSQYYGIKEEGNWEKGYNILHRPFSDASLAQQYQLEETELREIIADSKQKLLAARSQRIRPGLDDKILTAWNGLALKGLADAYAVLNETPILEAALNNARFIQQHLAQQEQEGLRLFRTFKEGKANLPGYLEDYACVISGLIALYQVSFEESWLAMAQALTEYTLFHFLDQEEGFFYYTDTSSTLIARKKEIFDNVMPASNSMMARNLFQLGILLENDSYRQLAEKMMANMLPLVLNEPGYLSNWTSLATEMAHPMAEIAIVGPELFSFSARLHQHYHPFKLLAGTVTSSSLPLLTDRQAINGTTTLYVCYNKTCQLPVHSPEEALRQLRETSQPN